MAALGKLKYQPQSIVWVIDLKTYEPTYYMKDKQFIYDPRHYILGTFLKPSEERPADKSRYKISKR